MNLEKLHRDPTMNYALYLNPIDLMNICLTSKEFNRKICNNELFWAHKLKIDFGPKIESDNSKKLYYKLAYDSLILYHNDKKIAKRVKMAVKIEEAILYLTVFGELYKFSENSGKELIMKNVLDISYANTH